MNKLLRLNVSHMYDTEDEDGPNRLEVLLGDWAIARIRQMQKINQDNDLDGCCVLDRSPRVFNYNGNPWWDVKGIRLHVTDSGFWWEVACGDRPYEWTTGFMEIEDLDNKEPHCDVPSWNEENDLEWEEDDER